jgi:hypothetical protein
MKKIILPLVLVALGLSSCEDPVDIDIDNGISQLSIDAFINNLDKKQIIHIKQSKEFFDSNEQVPVLNATVKVVDSEGSVYNFLDNNNKGEYSWDEGILVKENLTYSLQVAYDGELYTCEEVANPVPQIDSLVVRPAEAGFGGQEPEEGAFQVELYAIDLAEREDFYWIKLLRNDSIDSRPGAINTSLDGGGSGSDGILFIPPVRFVRLNNGDRPYKKGETVEVQIHSVNENTYLFFNQVSNQINNSGLFAVPSSNVRTNIVSSPSDIKKKAIGMFSVSMVATIKEEI